MRLAGKTVLITGASRNIGREIALTCAREGADVAMCAHSRKDELEAAASQCRELGVKTYTTLADVAESAECRRFVEESLQTLGKIDVLIPNAAIRPHHPLLTVSDEDWHRVFALNLDSCFYLCKAVIPGMMERRSGSIIGIGGNAVVTGRPDTSTVTAAKTGLWGFIRAIAAEFAPYNIRANLINPGTIDTSRLHPEWFAAPERLPQGTSEQLRKIPLGRQGTVEDIANAVVFLASEESSYITGDQINVMGGRYILADPS